MLPPTRPDHEEQRTNNQVFNFAQLTFEFKAKSRVIDKLITMNTLEAFIADVVDVEKSLQQGGITSIRQLELELMFIGKVSLALSIPFLFPVRGMLLLTTNPSYHLNQTSHTHVSSPT